MRVKDCMCNNLVKASPETSVAEAAKLMNSNQIGCLPICSSEDKCVGFVTDRDIITRAVAHNKDCNTTKLNSLTASFLSVVCPPIVTFWYIGDPAELNVCD